MHNLLGSGSLIEKAHNFETTSIVFGPIFTLRTQMCLGVDGNFVLSLCLLSRRKKMGDVRVSPKNSLNKILLLIWRATSTFKASKDISIKILQIKNDILSSNLKNYFFPLQFIFYYFLLEKEREVF